MAKELDISRIPLIAALVPIVVLISLLFFNVQLYGDLASAGPNQVALLLSAALAAIIGRLCGTSFERITAGIVHNIGSALTAMLILLLIGGLTATWMASGVVPAMVYYGLQILSPQYLLVAAVVIASIVSVATGSSWTTVGTVGVALIGIGRALGVPDGMIAGAIISGAYFGDKISPLSDTTNLAAAMASVNLFTHIRYMMLTTTPTMLLTILIFWILGGQLDGAGSVKDAEILSDLISSRFAISPLLFLVPAMVVAMVIWRFDAIIALFAAMIVGALVAIVFQAALVRDLSGVDEAYWQQSYRVLNNLIAGGSDFSRPILIDGDAAKQVMEQHGVALPVAGEQLANLATLSTDDLKTALETQLPNQPEQQAAVSAVVGHIQSAQSLLKTKGMSGMLSTIWLIFCAMCFGGAMESCGLLKRITTPLVTWAQGTASLIATTAGSCIFVNVTASDQYLAIVVPGRMFRRTFAERGLAPQNLSRTLEDAGTVTSVLVPWNTCGATQQAALNVAVLTFAPYCFFCWISPLMTIAFGLFGIMIARQPPISGDEADADSSPQV